MRMVLSRHARDEAQTGGGGGGGGSSQEKLFRQQHRPQTNRHDQIEGIRDIQKAEWQSWLGIDWSWLRCFRPCDFFGQVTSFLEPRFPHP